MNMNLIVLIMFTSSYERSYRVSNNDIIRWKEDRRSLLRQYLDSYEIRIIHDQPYEQELGHFLPSLQRLLNE